MRVMPPLTEMMQRQGQGGNTQVSPQAHRTVLVCLDGHIQLEASKLGAWQTLPIGAKLTGRQTLDTAWFQVKYHGDGSAQSFSKVETMAAAPPLRVTDRNVAHKRQPHATGSQLVSGRAWMMMETLSCPKCTCLVTPHHFSWLNSPPIERL